MSDTPPNKQTSSVPLKKETVRVTLKASDVPPAVPKAGETVRITLKKSDSLPSVPSAEIGQAPPPVQSPPSKPPIPKPTSRLGGAPRPKAPAGAPTAPAIPKPKPTTTLGTARTPTPPTGAPTVKLGTSKSASATGKQTASNAPIGAPIAQTGKTATPPTGAPTIKLGSTPKPQTGVPTMKLNTPTGAPTMKLNTPTSGPTPTMRMSTGPLTADAPAATLPQATQALNPPTQPLKPTGAATAHSATVQAYEPEIEVETQHPIFAILAGVGTAAALLVLGLQYSLANVWISAEDNPKQGGIMQILD